MGYMYRVSLSSWNFEFKVVREPSRIITIQAYNYVKGGAGPRRTGIDTKLPALHKSYFREPELALYIWSGRFEY